MVRGLKFRVQVSGFRIQLGRVKKNNHFTEMCSDSETGSFLRPIDFV